MAAAQTTTDHDTIRQWVEQRNGKPARVRGTGDGRSPGILRIDFPGYGEDDALEELAWDEWFKTFEDNNLAFHYQENINSSERRFVKLIDRDENQESASVAPQKARQRRKRS
jgi:hypothetical protein